MLGEGGAQAPADSSHGCCNENSSVRVQHVPSCRGHWLPPQDLPCPGTELGCWHQQKSSGERPLGPPPPGHRSLTSVSTARMGPDKAVVPTCLGPCRRRRALCWPPDLSDSAIPGNSLQSLSINLRHPDTYKLAITTTLNADPIRKGKLKAFRMLISQLASQGQLLMTMTPSTVAPQKSMLEAEKEPRAANQRSSPPCAWNLLPKPHAVPWG